ncbi:MAG: biotin synthase BioB [Candidatus Methylomirabilales bacterium]
MRYDRLGELALGGDLPSRADLLAVLCAPDDAVPALLDAAFQVRRHHFGVRVQLHRLVNAKSGLCPEDCGYCSQSRVSTAPIERYPFLPLERLLQAARAAKAARALRFCIVNSGRGPTERELDQVVAAVEAIRAEVPINICCCLGLLTDGQARRLKAAGVERVNHNLNTSRRFYPRICQTHSYDDRVRTLEAVRQAGISTCSGGIVGMGETDEDILDLALHLRALDVDSIPVNFLHPIAGTPLAGIRTLDPRRCLKVLCLFRFVLPAKEIRVAGGRELNLGSLQPLALYPANSIFVEGYLTTPGQTTPAAHRMIADLGFEIDETPPGPSHSA